MWYLIPQPKSLGKPRRFRENFRQTRKTDTFLAISTSSALSIQLNVHYLSLCRPIFTYRCNQLTFDNVNPFYADSMQVSTKPYV